jgi:ADP-ribose pyrophosphatase YjhB (NUDIX family)
MSPQSQSHRNPVPTVDIIIEIGDKIVIIERKNPPYGWALPGGFVDYGETVEEAAVREAKEETSLDLKNLRQFRVFSAPDRDPRLHTITTVFIARGEGEPKAADDAQNIELVDPRRLNRKMAFDHREIIDAYVKTLGEPTGTIKTKNVLD